MRVGRIGPAPTTITLIPVGGAGASSGVIVTAILTQLSYIQLLLTQYLLLGLSFFPEDISIGEKLNKDSKMLIHDPATPHPLQSQHKYPTRSLYCRLFIQTEQPIGSITSINPSGWLSTASVKNWRWGLELERRPHIAVYSNPAVNFDQEQRVMRIGS